LVSLLQSTGRKQEIEKSTAGGTVLAVAVTFLRKFLVNSVKQTSYTQPKDIKKPSLYYKKSFVSPPTHQMPTTFSG
jgi:hypothetical protein